MKRLSILIILFTIIVTTATVSPHTQEPQKAFAVTQTSIINLSNKEITTNIVEPTSTTSALIIPTEITTIQTTTTSKAITTTTQTTTSKPSVTSTTINSKKKPITATAINQQGQNLGNFKITVYTAGADGGGWGYQTATGVRSTHLQTCAVDPNVIPLGSKIYINGLTLLACDTGNAIKGNHIDIFYDGSNSAACNWADNFGYYHDVILLNN